MAKSRKPASKAAAGRSGSAATSKGGNGEPAMLDGFQLNAYPDAIDFRDLMYVPTLVEVDEELPLDQYIEEATRGKNIKLILNQGREGACTGFGLAAVVHYLLRTRDRNPDETLVSARMLYESARRYDEWPGEDYSGSSARGAMKGWHKHGVCTEVKWPYDPNNPGEGLTPDRAREAIKRPLGAYFRVDHKDLVAMHAAITEVGILYATAGVHKGWSGIGSDGKIEYTDQKLGGHAFAIVAYDTEGFWIQNSWDTGWGKDGFGHISYADWLENGTDVWVARLAVPITLAETASAKSASVLASRSEQSMSADVRPHLISIGNDGVLRTSGAFGTSVSDVERLVTKDFVEITKGWKRRRILLYAHGGLVGEKGAIQRTSEYLKPLLENEIYPVAFIWKTDAWSTITNIIKDAFSRRRPEGILDAAKDFMLDRLDDTLEPLARLPGKAMWDEMKENGLLASTRVPMAEEEQDLEDNDELTDDEREAIRKSRMTGGARQFLDHLTSVLAGPAGKNIEIHVAGHSAGSIFMAPVVERLTAPLGKMTDGGPGMGRTISTCTLWAPACTAALFEEKYLPAIKRQAIEDFDLYTLTDAAERDDNCAGIYHKSLLYLVAHSFEDKASVPIFRPKGTPILGMQRTIDDSTTLKRLFNGKTIRHILAPNAVGETGNNSSTASHHGDFDDDKPTTRSLLLRILGKDKAPASLGKFEFTRSDSSNRAIRQSLK